MDMENFIGPMEGILREIGLMENSMAREFIRGREWIKRKKDFGKMASE